MTYIGPEKIIEKKKEYLIPCSYHFFKEPPQMVSASMQYMYDSEGRQYTDCFSGVSVMNCGHCNPSILEHAMDQMKKLQHTTSIYLTEPVVNLAEKLAGTVQGELKRSFFCNSGSEANETAMLLAKLHTGNSEFIALRHGLHGRTALTMSVTGIGMWRADPVPAGGVSFAMNAYCYRCPYGATPEHCNMVCAKGVEDVIKNQTSGKLAAMIAETIQGNGGIITPPPGYFKALKDVLGRYGIPLIIDEVQTGFGRTGKFFAFEHYGIEPEILTVAKALGNGVPIGACMTTDELAAGFTRPSASTLGGNPVSSAAAMAVLDYIEREKLTERARHLGDRLKNGLEILKEKHGIIGDVRGIGLMLGAELVKDGKLPATEETDNVLEKMKDRGYLIGKNGENRNVLAFQPPLVIEEADIDGLLDALDGALEEIG